LIVFPTELSLRRFQQDEALKQGWIDASGHMTFARLRKLCLPYAGLKGKLPGPARELMLRREAVEVASGHFVDGGPLGELSGPALGDVLEKLATELATLPEENGRIVDWLLHRSPKHKLYQLGMLYSVWRTILQQEGCCDALDANAAILRLLKGDRQKWPPLLRDAKRLTFRSVRWFTPFEESCVAALNQKMKLRVESALPPAHAEAAADRLGQQIRAEIMGSTWAVWVEDLGDALAVASPDVLQLDDGDRITFSRSAGAYGEIEDLARRICWTLETCRIPPHRVALVVPDIGTVQDIVPHVFSRFRIPYYFRRGRPVLSSPCVKAFLAWLSFPLRPERDTLIDLLRNPALRLEEREETVAKLLNLPPLLDHGQAAPLFRGAPVVEQAFQSAHSGMEALEILQEYMVAPDGHFNAEALKAVAGALEGLGKHKLPLRDLVGLLEELLVNATVRPLESHEQGVWILNPHDAVGLDFDLVCFAGLNEGEFPGITQQDALLSDRERRSLWKHLEGQGRHLPKLALPAADVKPGQESILFLASLGMAREQVVVSCQAVDQEGNEKGESEYYRKLWNLAGWCAHGQIALSPYDQWRSLQLDEENIFTRHVETQQGKDAEERVPMPGESFLPIVPLPLCRAEDEALQAAVSHGGTASSLSRGDEDVVPPASTRHLVEMLNIEAEREAFLNTPIKERERSTYCGHVGALREKVADWFARKEELGPTALETLAQCRYVFLLERIFGMEDPRRAEDMPDPMERGGLIHSILHEIYTAVAIGKSGIAAPRFWAVKTSNGWVKRSEGGADAIPLATFDPAFGREYDAFARTVAQRRLNEEMLGHPGVWAAEQEKILTMVLNFVRYDVETCAAENRFPGLFELKFGSETAVNLGEVKIRGMIDRVDLVFDDTGALERIRVLDYKGSSRVRSKTAEYVDEILHNLDCQLPAYAFAAQHFFLNESNTPVANSMTEAGYLFYQRDFKDIGKTLKKSLVPMDEEGMVSGFLATLFENIQRLKDGDFAVDPLVAAYNDYQSVCRTEAVAREELD
jgi:RecB family exonuclease